MISADGKLNKTPKTIPTSQPGHPVIETQDQFTGLLAVTYQFGPLAPPDGAAPLK